MRQILIALLVVTGIAGPAVARDPLTGLVESFFNYQAPPPPVGGNCSAIAAQVGDAAGWRGEFSGKRWLHNDRFAAFSARGCFDSEIACRAWQQQAINYADGPITYMTCEPGLRGGRG